MHFMRSARGMTVIVSLVAVALLVGSCCGRAPVKKPPSPVWTVEVTPVEDTNPTKTQHTFIATVFDRDGRPLPNVQVHWILARTGDAVGDIVAYDDQDLGVGMARALTRKTDNYYAVSYTNEKPAVLHAGMRWKPDPADRKNFEVLPGQTWCTITSPVEGDSHMIVYVPAIEDARCHKVFAVKHWRPQPALTITKECPPEVGMGETFEYVITVSNNGDGTAHNVWVTDQFPAGIDVVEGPSFPHNLGDIGPGETAPPIRVSVRAGARLEAGPGGANLMVKAQCPPQVSLENGTGQFSVSMTNNSAEPLQDVSWNARLLGAGSPRIEPSNGTFGVIAPNETKTVQLTGSGMLTATTYTMEATAGGRVVVSQAMEFVNKVEARDGGGQGEFYARAECRTRASSTVESPGQGQDSCTVIPEGTPNLRITKSMPGTVACNEEIDVVVKFWNPGTKELPNVEVVDQLPQGWTWVSGDQPTWSGSLPAGGSESSANRMTFKMKAPAREGSFTNTATARGGSLSDTASAMVTVMGPILSVRKDCQMGDFFRGGSATATITITNSNQANAYNVVVTDQITSGRADLLEATMDGKREQGKSTWNIPFLAKGETKVINTQFMLLSEGTIVNQVTVSADCARSVSDNCQWVVLAPPALQQSIKDRLGNDDTRDPFLMTHEFNYLIEIENEGDLALRVDMVVEFPPEIDPVRNRAYLVAGPNDDTPLTNMSGKELQVEMKNIGGRRYKLTFGKDPDNPGKPAALLNNLVAKARAFIVVLAKGNKVCTDVAFTVNVSLKWNAVDSAGKELNMSGAVSFGETSWIGTR